MVGPATERTTATTPIRACGVFRRLGQASCLATAVALLEGVGATADFGLVTSPSVTHGALPESTGQTFEGGANALLRLDGP